MHRLALLLLLLPLATTAQVAPERAGDPVVLTGADLPVLLGEAPEALAAFRWTVAGWVPVPLQVDERAIIDLGDAFGSINPNDCETFLYCIALTNQVETLFWTDPDTFIGGDPDATFDPDDEVAMMAGDGGPLAPEATERPVGTVGAGTQVAIGEGEAYLYLFAHDGTLDPSAGSDLVRYEFDLVSGDYLTTYDVPGGDSNGGEPAGYALGANPEDTTVETDAYRLHFSDRWILDAFQIASGADLLDRRKVLFSPGDCARHETTGSRGEGAFVVNRDGPVRALRSVVGFNSGPLVQRSDVYYADRIESTTALRVHQIPGVMDLMDYSPEARGMTYYANTQTRGVVIDGDVDSNVSNRAPFEWDAVTGEPGTLVMRHTVQSNVDGLEVKGYYSDDDTTPPTQCTGDAEALGQSGLWVRDAIPSTDPRLGSSTRLAATRTTLVSPDALTLGQIEAAVARLDSPLAITASPLATASGDAPEATAGFLALWPNPSSGTTSIAFEMSTASEVHLSILDALGREVATLARGTFASGAHRVSADARGLAPGVYLIRLETATAVQVQPFTRL